MWSILVLTLDRENKGSKNKTHLRRQVKVDTSSITGETVPSGIYLLLIETEDTEPVTAKVIVR